MPMAKKANLKDKKRKKKSLQHKRHAYKRNVTMSYPRCNTFTGMIALKNNHFVFDSDELS